MIQPLLSSTSLYISAFLMILIAISLPRVHIVSDAFKSKPLPTRHRLIYALLKDEMQAEEGIHALQLTTRTRDEEDKARQKEGQSVEQ